MTAEYDDRYLGARPTEVEISGRNFAVNVHLAWLKGRLTCVGLDVRSFREDISGDETRMEPTNDTWVEVNSPVMRALRTSEVIDAAQEPFRELVTRFTATFGPPTEGTSLANFAESLSPAPRAKRGPRPQLDDEALRDVVAATYRVSVRRPVQAVREALETSGLLRPPVTIDQARKAVAAARARGFIPPAERGSKRQEDQP